ncbi:hypothetical protein PMI03_00239 [Rhizobium sp. AP16]|nr:hypothetical protein PMI03_00239 [Rhizobium sp. AP16]
MLQTEKAVIALNDGENLWFSHGRCCALSFYRGHRSVNLPSIRLTIQLAPSSRNTGRRSFESAARTAISPMTPPTGAIQA